MELIRAHQPIAFRCGQAAPNRLALAPLTNVQSRADGTLSDEELRWLTRRAQGGFGIVMTCAAYVSPQGKAWRGQLGVADDAHLPGLTRLAEALHEHDTCAMVQLHHAGAKATLAPQKLSTVDDGDVRGAKNADLERVRRDYVNAALRAQRAGFDGVEIHGANGYIFTQFLAPADNPRTDEYGGGLDGRARLLRETMRDVRVAVGPDFLVGVRISPVDTWDRRGLLLDDSVQVAQWLVEDGADVIHLSLRDASGPPPFEENDTPVVTAFREALPVDIPVMAAGGIRDANDLEAALSTGVDIPTIGRAAIGDPDWARNIVEPGWSPTPTPLTRAHLTSVDVSPVFVKYLLKFPGLIEGGTPARDS